MCRFWGGFGVYRLFLLPKQGGNCVNCVKKYPFESGEAEMSMELTSSDMVDEQEDIRYTTYGFRVLDHTGNVLYCAEDVDTKQTFVERFIEFCTESDIRLIHIPDLLEDYLDQR